MLKVYAVFSCILTLLLTIILWFWNEWDIEDITWPRRDTKFLFECWKIFHEWAQRTSEIFSTHEEKFCISKRPCNVLLICYINTNEIPNHFTETVLSCERCDLSCSHSKGDIFTCENNMLFSCLKISCFRATAHLVFHWCLCNKVCYFNWRYGS